MPEEKLLFDNGTLESDEETTPLCPAQRDTEWPGVLEHSLSHLSVQEGSRRLVKTHIPGPYLQSFLFTSSGMGPVILEPDSSVLPGRCAHRKTLSSVPGLYPPDASSSSPGVTTKIVSRHCQMASGRQIVSIENHH